MPLRIHQQIQELSRVMYSPLFHEQHTKYLEHLKILIIHQDEAISRHLSDKMDLHIHSMLIVHSILSRHQPERHSRRISLRIRQLPMQYWISYWQTRGQASKSIMWLSDVSHDSRRILVPMKHVSL